MSFGGNLARRVATAAVALPALVAALFLGPPGLIVGIVAATGALGLWEYFRLLRARQLRPARVTGFLLAAVFFWEALHPRSGGSPLWPAAVLLLLAVCVRPGADPDRATPTAAWTTLGAVYLGVFPGVLAALRVIPPVEAGAWRLVLLLAIVMLGDSFAFFVGHALGRHRLAPTLSPGKSVEGALGGILGGILAALAVRRLGLPLLPPGDAVILGAVVSVLGVAGDLFESLLKRWAGVKDSGALFPGHGGMLDRLDSLLFGAPVLYYYFLAWP